MANTQWIKMSITATGGSNGRLEIDYDPTFSDVIQEAWLYAELYIPQVLRDAFDAAGGTQSGPIFYRGETFPTNLKLRRENVGPTYLWRVGSPETTVKTWTELDQWVIVEMHLNCASSTFEIRIDGTIYSGFPWTPPSGLSFFELTPIWSSSSVSPALSTIYYGIDNMAVSTEGWVSDGAEQLYLWELEEADPVAYTAANYPDPPFDAELGSHTVLTVSTTAPGPGPGPPVEDPEFVLPPGVSVFVDDVNVSTCVLSGSVTRRLNRPWAATWRMPSDCDAGGACSKVRIYVGQTLWFHGFIDQVERDCDEDFCYTEYTASDPMSLWQWRPARAGPNSITSIPGDFSNPQMFEDFQTGPQILEQCLLQSEDDTTPADGEGTLFLDHVGFATGGKILKGAPVDWPMTIAEVFELMSSTGVVDAVLTPTDIGPNMASIEVFNGDYGTDHSDGPNGDGTVIFEYATGNHNVRALRQNIDSTNLVNKLWYYLGPRRETATDPGGDQHWAGNITGQDPAYNPAGSAQGAWGSGNAYAQFDVVTNVIDGDTIYFIAKIAHTSNAKNEPGVGIRWSKFWSVWWVPPGGRSVDENNDPVGPPWTDNALGERIYDSRTGGCGVRMEIQIFDAQGDENPSTFRELYHRRWQMESWLRAIPRELIHIQPVRTSDADLLPPGVTPVQVGDFDIGDLVTVSAGAIVGGGFTGIQRVYEYTVSWDEDGVLEIGELQTSSDQEGLG